MDITPTVWKGCLAVAALAVVVYPLALGRMAFQLYTSIQVQKPNEKTLTDASEEELDEVPLFKYFPALRGKIAWLNLGTFPSPVHSMSFEHPVTEKKHTIYLKREDMVSDIYGGNKVRTLTHLLACAIRQIEGTNGKIYAIGGPGSNQIVATASYSQKNSVPFVSVPLAPEGESLDNSLNLLSMTMLKGWEAPLWVDSIASKLSFVKRVFTNGPAINNRSKEKMNKDDAIMNFGGNNPIGALGHVTAIFEICDQIRSGELPQTPKNIVLALGSSCTTAGLCAGLALARKTGHGFTDVEFNGPSKLAFNFKKDFNLYSVIIHHQFTWIPFVVRLIIRKVAGDVLKIIYDLGGPDASDELDTVMNCLILETRYAGSYGSWSEQGLLAYDVVNAETTVVEDMSESATEAPPIPWMCSCFTSKAFGALLDRMSGENTKNFSLGDCKDGDTLFWCTKSLVQPFHEDLSWQETIDDKLKNNQNVLNWLSKGKVNNHDDWEELKTTRMTKIKFSD